MSCSAFVPDPDEDLQGYLVQEGQVSSEFFLATLVKHYFPIIASLPRKTELL